MIRKVSVIMGVMYRRVLFTLLTVVLAAACFSYPVRAESLGEDNVETVRSKWYETKDYPLTPENEEWEKYGNSQQIEIANPPEDLLESLRTEELVALLLDYPFLSSVVTYEHEKINYFFYFMEVNCDIYNELLKREDGVTVLLQSYQNNNFDPGLYTDETLYQEIFVCEFIRQNTDKLTDDEAELCSAIIPEKSALYEKLPEGTTKTYLAFDKPREEYIAEVKARWYETRYYPITWGKDGNSKEFTLFETNDLLNPPTDLLLSMSSEELTLLLADNHWLSMCYSFWDEHGNQDYHPFMGIMEEKCDMFYELLRRGDGMTCMLNYYRNASLEPDRVDSEAWYLWSERELFGNSLINFYWDTFTPEECELARAIIEEKQSLYGSKYDFPDLTDVTGAEYTGSVRTKFLTEEQLLERQQRWAATTPYVEPEKTEAETVENAKVEVGTEKEMVNETGNASENVAQTDEKVSSEDEAVTMEKQMPWWGIVLAICGICVVAGIVVYCLKKNAR